MAYLKLQEACQQTQMSKWWFYRLDPSTPGIFRFGRSIRVDVQQLTEWLRSQSEKPQ